MDGTSLCEHFPKISLRRPMLTLLSAFAAFLCFPFLSPVSCRLPSCLRKITVSFLQFELPAGSNLETTDKAAHVLEDALRTFPSEIPAHYSGIWRE